MIKTKSSQKRKTDELTSNKTFTIGVYIVLCFVAFVMTLLNVITHKGNLTLVTGIFAVLCIFNIIFVCINEKMGNIARILFSIEIIAMFTFFLISGNPDGFSAIWIALLPSASMFFFGRRNGSVICAAMLFIMVILLWMPFGEMLNIYEYNATFRMRFPILFIAFYSLAFFLETRRVKAYTELYKLQDYYRELSARDSLTKLYNRQGMYSRLKEDLEKQKSCVVYVIMFDIDNFKHCNDTYGHDIGDAVLKAVSELISQGLKGIICRWGGEEFVAIVQDYYFNKNELETLRKTIEAHDFKFDDKHFNVTVSIGVCNGELNTRKIDSLVADADVALYEAKTTGKNKTVYFKK